MSKQKKHMPLNSQVLHFSLLDMAISIILATDVSFNFNLPLIQYIVLILDH